MTTDIYWRIPTHGESSTFRKRPPNRGDWSNLAAGNQAPGLKGGEPDGFSYVDYMAEVAKAAELSGFHGGLIPSFPMTDDPWVIAPWIARVTKAFHFMIAFQPGFLNPVQAARMSASLQRASGGRLVYNIITGGGGPQQLWWGDSFTHDDRYGRTTEFLDILKGVWQEENFSYDGRFYQVENAGLGAPFKNEKIPDIYFSGSSDAALASASKHADYYLSWLEPFAQLGAKFAKVRENTDKLGRKIKCAVRVDLIARRTEDEAWAEVKKAYESLDGKARANFSTWRSGDSVGAQRQGALGAENSSRYEDLIVAPNLWSGFSLLRGGPALGIVGDYEQVAERLDQLIDLGADAFILAGTPHLEEAYRVGEEVLPLLRGRSRQIAGIAAE